MIRHIERKTRKRCAARAVAYQTCCMRYDAGWTAPQRIPPRRRDRGAQHPNRKPAASDKLHTPAEMSEAEPRRIKTDQDVTPRQWDGTHASSATPPSDPRHQRREGVEGGSACTSALRQDGGGEVCDDASHTSYPSTFVISHTHTHTLSVKSQRP